jgi:fibronectin type 3 domain-containing protein
LIEDTSVRTSTENGLTWSEGAHDGGLNVIDYRINQKVQGGSYSVIAVGVATTSYTVTSLSLGTTYEFTVEARNNDGYSSESSSVTLFHATAPDTPATPSTSNTGTDIVVSWSAPSDNGSTITSYQILIR